MWSAARRCTTSRPTTSGGPTAAAGRCSAARPEHVPRRGRQYRIVRNDEPRVRRVASAWDASVDGAHVVWRGPNEPPLDDASDRGAAGGDLRPDRRPARSPEWQTMLAEMGDIAGRPGGIGSSFVGYYRVAGRRLTGRLRRHGRRAPDPVPGQRHDHRRLGTLDDDDRAGRGCLGDPGEPRVRAAGRDRRIAARPADRQPARTRVPADLRQPEARSRRRALPSPVRAISGRGAAARRRTTRRAMPGSRLAISLTRSAAAPGPPRSSAR